MRDNVAAWTKWKLLPQVLRDMGDVRTSTTVLGIDVDAPILIAPTAMHRFVCRRRRARHRRPPPRRTRSTSCRWRRRRRSRTSPRRLPTAPAGRRCTCSATGSNALARRARRRIGYPRSSPASTAPRCRVAAGSPAARSSRPTRSGSRTARPRRPDNTNLMAMVLGLRPDRHVRRPRVVRGVERAPRGREGRDARRRRRAVRRRRRGRRRDLEPRRTHPRRRGRDRRRAARDRRRGGRAGRGLRRRRHPQRHRRAAGGGAGRAGGDDRAARCCGAWPSTAPTARSPCCSISPRSSGGPWRSAAGIGSTWSPTTSCWESPERRRTRGQSNSRPRR